MSKTVSDRFILRAEIRSAQDEVISYGFDLTTSSIFVVTDWLAPPAGTRVSLRLSCPKVLTPIELEASIDDVISGAGLGEPSGVRLKFEAGERDKGRINSLLARVTAPAQPTPREYRILLVEDNGFIRDVFAYSLGKFLPQPGTHAIDHAENAERAWEKLEHADYDLVIVDYYLPAANGASLIARLRRDPRLSEVPVVAMSVGGRDAHDATISAGADLFLDKPLVLRDLFNTLRMIVHQGASASSQRKKAILVFDDSPLILSITRSALEAAGFEVAVAETLAAFEDQRTTFDPDLILVDIQMPEAFGDDVVATLREWHNVRIPIFLVSSLDEAELAQRAEEAHAAGYISKSKGMTELVRRCKEALEAAA